MSTIGSKEGRAKSKKSLRDLNAGVPSICLSYMNDASDEAFAVTESQCRRLGESQATSDQRESAVPLRYEKAICRSLQSLLPGHS